MFNDFLLVILQKSSSKIDVLPLIMFILVILLLVIPLIFAFTHVFLNSHKQNTTDENNENPNEPQN